ncbi:type II toxin-antitoxin system VapC family toxin [Bosea sp. PAMC 26642]|uniref:type II toxin-antitoxin system VapC family toxin n=1 Tax=Bosea sp. (strain PAMC 26642) TaxID=1792307 RepID=UPI0007703C93|nr:type II toxin-antitoxin system VapC family toxin [Bosea sp. PAMC 26642]AMJ60674.1 hypothetical protein AXW83_10580 [Bosea sp. PAMC 26642]
MRLLLDSHVMLWWTGLYPGFISQRLHDAMAKADSVAISAATIWELEIKRNAGKLALPADAWVRVTGLGIACLQITQEDAVAAGGLPPIHRDPFDRMIVAQAIRRDLVLVTGDAILADYSVALIRI